MNNQINLLLTEAINHFQKGELSQTKLFLSKLLIIDPENFDALHIMGVTLGLENQNEKALNFLFKASKINPTDNLINLNLAKALVETNRNSDALTFYNIALDLSPQNAEAWSNKAVTLHNLELYPEALIHFNNAIQLKHELAEAWCGKGITLKSMNRLHEALQNLNHAIQLKPNYANAWSNKGGTLKDLKRYDEALACYDKAITLKPDFAEAWSNKGITLHDLKRYPEALSCFNKAIALKPNFAKAWVNKGLTLQNLHHYDEALSHYNQAILLKPDFPEALSNKAATLNILKNCEESLSNYEKAFEIKPDLDFLCGDLLHLKMKMCDWSSNNELLKKCIDGVESEKKVIQPFQLLALTDNLFLQKKCSEIYSTSKYPFLHSTEKISPVKHKKIRLGYFSADFRDHPVSNLTIELFENHNKNRFEIYAFSYGIDDGSTVRKRLQNTFDKFIDVRNMSDTEIANLAKNMNIDIAIDLGGHTSDNRLSIFAHRVAPIQVTYIGYIGTLGTTFIDYLIADKVVIPKGLEKFYSEKIIRLPFYQISDTKRTGSSKNFTKADLGIPNQAFVFCCFNNNYKMLPMIFDSWVRIINAVENSVLFLFAENQKVKDNLIKEAKIRGLDEGRLIFGKSLPKDEYLARYLACDLFLDTFPYNAGTTANDALWMGLPILTYSGQSFASRMATSLLHAIGLEELCVDSLVRYEEMAIFLGNNPRELSIIKNKLAVNKFKFPIFKGKMFTENLEEAFASIYTNYIHGAPPTHLEIN